MGDFLSNFDKDNYGKTEKQKQFSQEKPADKQPTEPLPSRAKKRATAPKEPTVAKPKRKTAKPKASVATENKRDSQDEDIEIDPTFKKKQRRNRLLIALLAVLVVVAGSFGYYQMTHVKLTNFVDKEVSEARNWLADNDLKLELIQEYDEAIATNKVISQKQLADKKIKKGSTIQITASKGPDPDATLPLPDFLTMSKASADEWKAMNKADNLSIIEEYNDTVEKGQGIRVEFNNKDTTRENYRRKEKVKIYYSKGPETYEKNIEVLDFVNKAKAEVETWSKKNEIKITYQEESSDTIAPDNVISQSITKGEKVAKKDEMTVSISTGKAIVVPNFGDFSFEDAATAGAGLTVQVKSIYSNDIAYGQLVSQSIPAGTALTSKDDLNIKVTYSLGKPYFKDIRGTQIEGDLPKYFYDEFTSKGANITYQVRYVDSAETKGMVVGTNVVNQYIPIQYTIYVDISRGNLQGIPQYDAAPANAESQKQPIDLTDELDQLKEETD
ncbi:beta-lactam-binding protein with PASTA domain [Enterococcus sp. PF1-24]|uniref:PASTA domain-containing protein n=1 Tax=unclassified Enterococcus TaxID=2608891 RepID=UPI002476F993|nr:MULTISPECIES: PASTA domain-containing protein [unclassified Enterococcus]MDH6363139.1 beta-lactam-binding protein with PASTA domain [Enterococcus sp. PFB1-1]MDH6400233.1 beta-lactam-binding protein with PASTA domain [Enterococcus sp. PF1-24]